MTATHPSFAPAARCVIRSVAWAFLGVCALTTPAFSQSVQVGNATILGRSAQPAGMQATPIYRRTEFDWLPKEAGKGLAYRVPASGLRVNDWQVKTLESPSAPSKSPASWWAPVASAILPGSGQALLRQQRSLAYVVAEAFMVIQASRVQSNFGDARERYRNIAADVARLQFGADRPVGPWDYYETLANPAVTASGSYDLAIGGKFTPESDELTYNGRQWLLARELYWASPVERPAENSSEYQKALLFYQSRAVQGSFRWSWRDNQNAKELYVQTINEANHSKQQGVSMVGLVAANHLLSMIDAYIAVRLRRYGGAGVLNASIKSELRPTGIPGGHAIATAMTVSMPIPGSNHRR